MIRAAAAAITLMIGVSIASIHQPVKSTAEMEQYHQVEAPTAPPAVTKDARVEDVPYPEGLGTTPYDIFSFIEQHPWANLDRLWQRLKIKRNEGLGGFDGPC